MIWTINIGLFFFVPSVTGKVMYTHVHDVVQGIFLAIEADKKIDNETFILCSDYITYENAIRKICKSLGRVQPFIKLPFFIVRGTVKMSKSLFNLFFNSVFLFHEKTVDQMILDRYYDNTKAKKMLGYEPKYNFEEGMNHTIKKLL